MKTPIAIRHDPFCPSSFAEIAVSIGESFAVLPHKTEQEACQQKPDVSCCKNRGPKPIMLAVMPYGGRCPNVGTLETSPKLRTSRKSNCRKRTQLGPGGGGSY